jgi:hypothetical protein
MKKNEITISKKVAILKAKQDLIIWVELKPGYDYESNTTITSEKIIGYLQDNLVERINFKNGFGDPMTLKVNYESI